MIAHIIPIKRMPRTLGLLSYSIPKELQKEIAVGQLVHMPLRQSTIHGLVFSIEQTEPSDELKAIELIVQDTPLFSFTQLEIIKTIADTYAISYGSAALLLAPPIQKRKLNKQDITPLSVTEHAVNKQHTLVVLDTEQTLYSVLAETSEQSLIIVPEIADIETIVSVLPDDLNIITWHSELSKKEQFERWFAVRNGTYDVVVGTRTSLFLPFQELQRIYLYREEDSSHKSWDQKPLYSTHDLLPHLLNLYGANLTYLTYSPRFDTYYAAAKKQLKITDTFASLHNPIDTPEIINMKDERKGGNYEILGERVVKAIKEATEDIALYINRKGYATAVGCTDCDYISRCNRCGMSHVFYASTKTIRCHYCGTAQRVPTACPSCNGTSLVPFGVGTEQVESYIKETFPNLSHTIVRIDSNQESIPELPEGPVLLIGTDRMFPHVRWKKTELLAMVQIDDQLLYPDYRAMESVWHTIRRINYHLPRTATWYIQTMQPEHLLIRSLQEPERLYRTDLSGRKQFNLPPYAKLIRLSIGKPTEFAAKTEAERIYNLLSRTLTKEGISASLREPYTTSPTFYRGRNWYTILVTLDAETWQQDIKQIIALLPGNWRVDISPQSLLSP